MTQYIVRRLFYVVLSAAVLSIVAFLIIQLPPGDFFTKFVFQMKQRGLVVDEAMMRALYQRFGFDRPLHEQYFKWIGNIVLRGDFGESMAFNAPVSEDHYTFCCTAKDINKPSVHAWKWQEQTTTVRIWVRNPYHYAVDTAGQQLPYIDRIVSETVNIGTYKLKVIAGEADYATSMALTDYPVLKQNEEAKGYTATLIEGLAGANVAYTFGVAHLDPVKRELFNNVEFSRAMSLAIDRENRQRDGVAGTGRTAAGNGAQRRALLQAGVGRRASLRALRSRRGQPDPRFHRSGQAQQRRRAAHGQRRTAEPVVDLRRAR